MADEILDLSAAQIAEVLASRGCSAIDLTRAAIARIEQRDAGINAVVVRDFDRALDAAGEADAALARGERRPLLGVPMRVKEAHNVAGLPTTWGLEPFRSWIAPEDAVGIARLKAAGAIIVGKTNVPAGLSDWQSVNPVYGRTHNPWDRERTPGGSSGGSAAALAARMVPLEFGSDIAGSIRVPSAFCGTYGHKPSYGLIPLLGHEPPGARGAPPPLPVLGPMARSAADLELMLDVLVGADSEEATAYRLELPVRRHEDLRSYRVLVLDHYPSAGLDGEILAAINMLSENLSSAGAWVVRESESLPDLAAAHEVYMGILMTVMTRGQPGFQSIPSHDYLGLLDAQAAIRRQWAALFAAHDVVIAPAFGTVAFSHSDEMDQTKRPLLIDGVPTRFMDQMAWAGMASLGHLPATAAPIGTTRSGLPIGIQIIGPYLEDLTTIAFAGLLEREFGGFTPPPGY